MGKINGRDGRLYVELVPGGLAEPVAYLNKSSMDFSSDKSDSTAYGDTNKNSTAGLPDAKLSYNGWYDDAGDQLYTAAQDGIERKFYWYPKIKGASPKYWFGKATFDMSIEVTNGETVSISGSADATTNVIKGP